MLRSLALTLWTSASQTSCGGLFVENLNPPWLVLTLPAVVLSLWAGNTGGQTTHGSTVTGNTTSIRAGVQHRPSFQRARVTAVWWVSGGRRRVAGPDGGQEATALIWEMDVGAWLRRWQGGQVKESDVEDVCLPARTQAPSGRASL